MSNQLTTAPLPHGANGTLDSWGSRKLQEHHLSRSAIVYVRQSSPHQVREHVESAVRQYALVERAVQIGWARARVEVIDEDQGQSGRSAENRLGFQRLLAEVGLDHVGIVLGIEMSRLARSNKDWHQLIELCAIFRTLLADQDGLYDPTDYNDRLLLGLKGTMGFAPTGDRRLSRRAGFLTSVTSQRAVSMRPSAAAQVIAFVRNEVAATMAIFGE